MSAKLDMYFRIYFLILLCLSITNGEDIAVKFGDKFKFCCKKVDPVIIIQNPDGILAFAKDDNKIETLRRQNYESMNSEFKNNKLCLTMRLFKFTGLSPFECIGRKADLGLDIAIETYYIKSYEDLKITEPNSDILSGKLSEEKQIKCSATGRPRLKLELRNPENVVVATGNQTINYPLKLTNELNNKSFKCIFSIDVKIPLNNISKPVKIMLKKKPTVETERNLISSDLGLTEEINLTVSGYPLPKIKCENNFNQSIKEESLSSLNDTMYSFKLIIKDVSKKSVGNYKCTFSNNMGVIKTEFYLDVKPMDIKLEKGMKVYSDVIPVKWNFYSRTKMTLIKLTLRNGNDIIEKIFVKDQIGRLATKPKSTPENNFKRTYLFFVKNLKENTPYNVAIKVCNIHDCHESNNIGQIKTAKGAQNKAKNAELVQISIEQYLKNSDSSPRFSMLIWIEVFLLLIYLI